MKFNIRYDLFIIEYEISDTPEGLSLIFLPRTNWKRHELEWWNFVFCWKSCWIIYLKEINTIQLWQSECCMNQFYMPVRPVWTCHALTLFCIGRFSSNIISSIPTYSSQDLDAILCSLLNIQNRTVPLIQVLRKKGIIYDRESGHRSVPPAQCSTNWNKRDMY